MLLGERDAIEVGTDTVLAKRCMTLKYSEAECVSVHAPVPEITAYSPLSYSENACARKVLISVKTRLYR